MEHSNSALAQNGGPAQNQAEGKNIEHVLLHYRSEAKTLDPSLVCWRIVKTVWICMNHHVAVVFVSAENIIVRHAVLAQHS